jgi:hypothetical protein
MLRDSRLTLTCAAVSVDDGDAVSRALHTAASPASRADANLHQHDALDECWNRVHGDGRRGVVVRGRAALRDDTVDIDGMVESPLAMTATQYGS